MIMTQINYSSDVIIREIGLINDLRDFVNSFKEIIKVIIKPSNSNNFISLLSEIIIFLLKQGTLIKLMRG